MGGKSSWRQTTSTPTSRALANALDLGTTRGVDWIELLIQIALAALGVALVAGRYAPGRRRL